MSPSKTPLQPVDRDDQALDVKQQTHRSDPAKLGSSGGLFSRRNRGDPDVSYNQVCCLSSFKTARDSNIGKPLLFARCAV